MITSLRLTLCISAALAVTVGGVAHAKAPAANDKMKACAAQWDAMKKAKTAKGSYKDFSKTCLASATTSTTQTAAVPQPVTVIKPAPAAKPKPAIAPTVESKPAPAPAPAAPAAVTHSATTTTTTTSSSITTSPAGATGQCKDGTFTHSKTHSGACSHHGGVAKWL